jgi:YVTN family beta-propeller protein
MEIRRIITGVAMVIGITVLGTGCWKDDDGHKDKDQVPMESMPEPSTDSRIPAGELSAGMIVLPNGRLITPMGRQLKLSSYFPMNLKATSDEEYLVVLCSGRDKRNHLYSVKIPEFTVTGTVEHSKSDNKSFWYGLVVIDAPPFFSATYPYLILAGGGHRGGKELDPNGQLADARGRVYVFGMDLDGNITPEGEIAVDHGAYVSAIALDQDPSDLDQAVLYVAYSLQNQVAAVKVDFGDLSGSEVLHKVIMVKYPYDLILAPNRETLYVTNWGTKRLADLPKVSVVDVSDADSATADPGMEVIREISVGKNPEGMAMTPDGKTLYVANSETDDIALIRTATNFVERFISLRPYPDDPYGIKPTALTLNHDESILLVASSGRNSLDLIDVAENKYLGSIPVGWNPTAAVEARGFWYVANGKGEGGTPSDYSRDCWATMPGSLSQIPVNITPSYLGAMTMITEYNNDRQLTYFEPQQEDPLKQYPIKHIIYVLKENKTYDQVMGDYPKGNGDPGLCVFCCDKAYGTYCYTPNTHALADRFVNLDNFYCDSEASITGHMWNTSSSITDYVEKAYLDMYRTSTWLVAGGIEPTSYTKAGFIFNHLKKAGIPFRDYGEIVGSIDPETGRQFDGVVIDSRWPLTFDMRIPDKEKIQVFIEHVQAGELAPFTFMLLPNDHTEGCSSGAWHPDSLVADNDEALGRLVDAVSHSEFWENTLIFVTEDDPQSGADHIESHRTIGLVISPWTKKGVTISTHYSWPNFYKTLEVIMGLPPLSTYDELAAPMYDVFDTEPHMEPYTFIPQDVPMEQVDEPGGELTCPRAAKALSKKADFSAPDQAAELAEILWMIRYPDRPFPAHLAGEDDDD